MRDAIQQEEQNTMLLAESDGCAVWQLRNETGEGTVTCYTIFPGVELRFRDLHMTHCVCGKTDDRMRLTIEHCREGRMAYALGEGRETRVQDPQRCAGRSGQKNEFINQYPVQQGSDPNRKPRYGWLPFLIA